MQIEILERNAYWAAVVKPAGISSEKDGMGRAVAETLKISPDEVYPVHRLDREVGGVMVYALTKEMAAFLSMASAEHRTGVPFNEARRAAEWILKQSQS